MWRDPVQVAFRNHGGKVEEEVNFSRLNEYKRPGTTGSRKRRRNRDGNEWVRRILKNPES